MIPKIFLWSSFLFVLFNFALSACRRDEVYKICPGCPATCQRDEPYVCFLPCVAKCVCRLGLLRDELTRRCVRPEACPSKTDNVTAVDNETATTVLEGYQSVTESATTLLPDRTTVRQKAKI